MLKVTPKNLKKRMDVIDKKQIKSFKFKFDLFVYFRRLHPGSGGDSRGSTSGSDSGLLSPGTTNLDDDDDDDFLSGSEVDVDIDVESPDPESDEPINLSMGSKEDNPINSRITPLSISQPISTLGLPMSTVGHPITTAGLPASTTGLPMPPSGLHMPHLSLPMPPMSLPLSVGIPAVPNMGLPVPKMVLPGSTVPSSSFVASVKH